jgi:hypothetical protein
MALLPDPSSPEFHRVVARDRLVTRLNAQRHNWANPLPLEDGVTASREQFSAFEDLLTAIGTAAGRVVVSMPATGASPAGIRVGKNFAIFRAFSGVLKAHRWTGEEYPPEGKGRPYRHTFKDAEHALEFALEQLLLEMEPAKREAAFAAIRAHAPGALFTTNEAAERIISTIRLAIVSQAFDCAAGPADPEPF